MGRARRERRIQEQKLMDYTVKFANPYRLLFAAGFSKNQFGRGFHIIECEKKNGFPARRIHAYVIDRRISMHHDLSLHNRRHITSHKTPQLRTIYSLLQSFDESFTTTLPIAPFKYRLLSKLYTAQHLLRRIAWYNKNKLMLANDK